MPKKGFGSRAAAQKAVDWANKRLGKGDVEYGVRSHTDPVTGQRRDDLIYRKPKRQAKPKG